MLFVLRYGIIIKPSSVGRFYYNVLYCSIGLFCFASRQASVMEGEDACAGVARLGATGPGVCIYRRIVVSGGFRGFCAVSAAAVPRPDRRGGVRRVNGCGL